MSLTFTIADGRFEWTGDSEVSADRLCQEPADEEARTAREEAADFLRESLADGPVPVKELKKEAKDLGIAEHTLIRAKKRLGVKSRKLEEHWVWELGDGR